MLTFKKFILNEVAQNHAVNNEALIILRKIIDMVDDGHVDYDSNKIKINVGRLIKNKKYNKLYLVIMKGNKEPRIGRHTKNDEHAIFLYANKIPERDAIDEFLSQQEHVDSFKKLFKKFLNDAVFDDVDSFSDSDYEKSNSINTRPNFEKAYIELVNKLNAEYKKYEDAKKSLEQKLENASDDLGHKEVIKIALDKLKKDMVGDSASSFKSKAIELFGKDNFKLLNKEFKDKLDSRLSDYYEHKFK